MMIPQILNGLGKVVNTILRPLRLELHRAQAWDRVRRATYAGGLDHLKHVDFNPQTIIDVGVAKGTPSLYKAFPNARHVLIDPLEEARPFMEAISKKFSHAEYIVAAASRQPGSILINVHPDLARSSVYWESDYNPGSVMSRRVPAITLDQVKLERNLPRPILLKVDVQGAELDVLDGASETLKDTECVVLETSLFRFFRGGPLIAEVVQYMKLRGFVIYDVWALQYRPHDGALTMIDLAFVKEEGHFRILHRFHPL